MWKRVWSLVIALGACSQPPPEGPPDTPDLTTAPSDGGGSSGGLPANDSFDGTALDPRWQFVRPEVFTRTLAGGNLELVLTQSALWYQNSQGGLMYQLVTGNFKMSATVHARSASNPGQPPTPTIKLGGLMARSPAGPPENYVHLVVGTAQPPAGGSNISVEHKTTANSVSTWDAPVWPSADAELRICRVGASFQLLKRAVGGTTWQAAASYQRPELPATLQAGINIYTANPQPDLLVRVEEIRFALAPDAASCTAD